jgi:hypothetical protein
MFSVMKQVYYYDALERYASTDVIISYDENSEVRIINNRNLELVYHEDIVYSSVFLNIYTLVSEPDSSFYVEIMSADTYELERLINLDVPLLSERGMVITSSLSTKNDLGLNDVMSIYINNVNYDFVIEGIIDDTSVFTGDKVFVLKDTLMGTCIGLSNLGNLGNVIYVNLASTITPEAFIDILNNDLEYKYYQIQQTIDLTEISRLAKYNSVLFFGVGVLMLFALILVLHSLFHLYFREYPIQSGVLSILGASKNYLFSIWTIEISIFLLISSVISALLTLFLVNMAGIIYGIHHFVNYQIWTFLLAFIGTALFLLIEVFTLQFQMKKKSNIELSSDLRYKKFHANYFLGIFSLLVLAIVKWIEPFSTGTNAILIVILSIIVMFQGFDIILFLYAKLLFKKKRQTIFTKYSIKSIKDNPTIHQSLRVLFVIFLVIVSVVSVQGFINRESKKLEDQIAVDYALLGIYDYQPTLKQEVLNNFDVSKVDEAIVYQNTLLHFGDESKRFSFNISMEYESFIEHFQFDVTNPINFLGSTESPEIILPINFKYIYDLNAGDTVTMDLSKKITGVSCIVVGFFETNFDNVVYSNIYSLPAYEDIVSINTLFIQTDNLDTQRELIQNYSMDMYYVISFQDIMADFTDFILKVTDMYAFLSSILIVCFIIVMINNTILLFYSMKSDYAKLKILGLDSSGFAKIILKEAAIIFFILVICSVLETFVLTAYFPKMMLVFHYYKVINPSILGMICTFGLVGIVLFSSYYYYLLKIKQMNVIEETKKY